MVLSIFPHLCLLCYHCFLPILASSPNHASRTFHLIEKSPEGTIVVNDLRQLLGVISNNDGSCSSSLLAISNAGLPGASSFKIKQTRGSLVVAHPPDRDVLCPTDPRGTLDLVSLEGIDEKSGIYHKGNTLISNPIILNQPCEIQLTIVFGCPSDPLFDSLTIILDDLNDHAPKFVDGEAKHVIRVLETAGTTHQADSPYGSKQGLVKMRIPLPEAIDLDSPANGVRHYRLEGEDAHLFHLEIRREGDEGTAVETGSRRLALTSDNRLWLVPSRMSGKAPAGLDHEQRNEYQFTLVAVDGGVPPRSARLPIHLVIDDVNDNAPTFTQAQYSGVVSEDDLPGHVILQLQASDADGKYENHRIGFRIPGKEGQSTDLSYSEAQAAAANFFEVELVSSYDYNSDSLSDYRKNVTAGHLITQRKSENQLRHAAKRALEAAKKLQISDIDASHSRLKYGPLNVRSYLLRFVVEAYDFGKSSLSSQVPVYVGIIDVNDEAPEIFVDYISATPQQQQDQKGICGTLVEGQGRSMIAQVTVIDNDAVSINAEVACILNDSRFSMELISTMGSPRWPITEAGTMKGNHAMLMYKLMANSPVDREGAEGGTISVQISCTDNQDADAKLKRLTSHVGACINIEDVNDNPPQFSNAVYTFIVEENLPTKRGHQFDVSMRGHFIGKVIASDRDAFENAKIEYFLSENTKGIVEVDAKNGSLYLVRSFDREKTKQFAFTVIARDQFEGNTTGHDRLSATAEVVIIVSDVNDCQPEFETSNYNLEVEENVELAEVGRVKATDADMGDFGRVRYSLAADDLPTSGGTNRADGHGASAMITSLFQIDSRLGIIRLRRHLDREKQANYEFLVLATDNVPLNGDSVSKHSAIRFTATATVLVMVSDQNDNPPQIIFPRNLAEFMLSPDQMVAGTTIFTIEANDNDQGENATIEYELITTERGPENLSDLTSARLMKGFPFAIDQIAGVCYLKQNLPPLGTDGVNLYIFRIKAYDLGTPNSLNSTVTVKILRGTKPLSGIRTDSFLVQGQYDIEGPPKAVDRGGAYPAGEWLGDWGGEAGGIPIRTLSIIFVAVFAVVFFLAILVYFYFRYQQNLNPRMIVNEVLGNPLASKGMEGCIAGNKASRLDSTIDAANRKYFFSEVVPAPWVGSPSSAVHSPMTIAYPLGSHRLMPQQQQQQQEQQQQQQFYLCRLEASLPDASPNQHLKSSSLKSPVRFTQFTSSPAFAPSSVVFRNYRTAGSESNYQTETPSMASKNISFQQSDCQYTASGGCISPKSNLLLSNTGELIDKSDLKNVSGLIRIDDIINGNGSREGKNSSQFGDGLLQGCSPLGYQRLAQESGMLRDPPQYVVHLPNCYSPLTFKNPHPGNSFKGLDFYPPASSNGVQSIATPTHIDTPLAAGKLAFRSLSIDSNLDNLSSSDYHPANFLPVDASLKGRPLHPRSRRVKMAALQNKVNLISNGKTLSPEVKGSFV